jgi:hypothetical protein
MERVFGGNVRRIGRAKGMMSTTEAQQQDRDVHEMYADILGTSPVWDANVSGSFSERFNYRALHSVRAYGAFLDHPPRTGLFRKPMESFSPGVDPSQHPSLRKVYSGASTTFPHLIHRQDNAGWYLPVDFPEPLPAAEGVNSAGSSVRLLSELERLSQKLGSTFTWKQLHDGKYQLDENDELHDVLYGAAFLTHCARLSLHYKLPIIFDA